VRELLRGLLDLALPPICGRCEGAVPRGEALCRRCDRALPRSEGDAPPLHGLAGCVAALAYEGEVLHWIRRFKYPLPGIYGLDPAAMSAARSFVREAAARVPGPPPQMIVPVPLHPRRLRSRGFNPAALLARTVAREIGVPVDPAALLRVRDTESQTGLDRAARRRNVRGAFRARRRLSAPPRVWLVDDVVTTGSTVAEAARVLRHAGARAVTAVCAARTPRRDGG
jgi:ComF family protein